MTALHPVALLPCETYDLDKLKQVMDLQFRQALPGGLRGYSVLLKPNLVSGRGHDGLACTNADFIAAAAELLADHGARLRIGDSPAFGSAIEVMHRCGIAAALKNLPIALVDFTAGPVRRLAHGVTVSLAREAFECDLLLNLPRVKAHSQMRVTLAVKNLFGAVLGWRKAMLHMLYDDRHNNFVRMLVDLLDLFPQALHLVDGIVAMHCTGPVLGSSFALGIVGLAQNPVALDTALLTVLDLPHEQSPIWAECSRRNLPGISLSQLYFPLQDAQSLQCAGFLVPEHLSPVRFNPLHATRSVCRRLLGR